MSKPLSSSWKWIDPLAVPAFATGEKLLLFGAGQGTTEFIHYIKEHDIQVEYVAIADNNLSLTGTSFEGLTIIDPATLPAHTFDSIIVTTVSGRDTVAVQLDSMGFAGQYACIGTYPASWQKNLSRIEAYNKKFHFLKPDKHVLHAGPGGFFGIELALFLYGCKPHSLDLNSFNASYPLVQHQKSAYDAVYTHLQKTSDIDLETLARRYEEAFCLADAALSFNTQAIPFYFPHSIEKMPFADASMDIVLSFSLLEHVKYPEQAVQEIYRVLKPSGICVQRITTADHRFFGNRQGFHPFSFFSCTEQQWNRLTQNTFYQNRLLPRTWFTLFQQQMDILLYKEEVNYTLTDAQWNEIKETCSPAIQRKWLDALVCDIIAIKPA